MTLLPQAWNWRRKERDRTTRPLPQRSVTVTATLLLPLLTLRGRRNWLLQTFMNRIVVQMPSYCPLSNFNSSFCDHLISILVFNPLKLFTNVIECCCFFTSMVQSIHVCQTKISSIHNNNMIIGYCRVRA